MTDRIERYTSDWTEYGMGIHTYYIVDGKYWYNANEYTEEEAIAAADEKIKREAEEARIRKAAKHMSNTDYYREKANMEYLFLDQEAYGDRLYYRNKITGEYFATFASIGD